MGRRTQALGLTLLELVTSLAIGGALLLVAVPTYHAWLADNEMRAEVGRLTNAMAAARAQALKRGHRVNLCPSGDGEHCADDGRWEQGWILFADEDGDGERNGDEPVIEIDPPSRPGVSVRANRPLQHYVSYTSLGHTRMANGALQMGTFTVCRPGRNAIEVVLANGGRVRVSRTGVGCP